MFKVNNFKLLVVILVLSASIKALTPVDACKQAIAKNDFITSFISLNRINASSLRNMYEGKIRTAFNIPKTMSLQDYADSLNAAQQPQSADQDDSGVASGDIQNVPMTPLSQETDQLSNDGDGISQGSDQSVSSSQQDQGFVSGVPTPTTPVITPTPIINPAPAAKPIPVMPMPGPVILAPTKIKEPMSKRIDQATLTPAIVPAMPANQGFVSGVPTPPPGQAPIFNNGIFNESQSGSISTGDTPPPPPGPAPIIGASSSHGTTPPPPPLPGTTDIIARSKDLAHVLPKDKKETKQDLIKQIDPKKFDVSQITAFKFKSFVEQYDLKTSKDNLKLKIDDKNIDDLAKDIAQVIDQLKKDKKCFLNGKPMPIKTAFVNADLIKLLTNIFDTFTKYYDLKTKNLIVSYDNKNFGDQFILFYDTYKDDFNGIHTLSQNYLKAISLFTDINEKLQKIDTSLKSPKGDKNANSTVTLQNAELLNQCIDDYETARILLLKECNIENLEKDEIMLFNNLQSAIRDFKTIIDPLSNINFSIEEEKVDSGKMLTAIKELTVLVDGYNNAAQQFEDSNYEPLSIPPLCLLTTTEIRQLKNNAIATNTLSALNNKYNHNQMRGEYFKPTKVVNINTKKPIRCIIADQNEIQSQDLKRPSFPKEIGAAFYGLLTEEDNKTPKQFDDGCYKIALIVPQVFNPLTDLELLKNLSYYKLKGLDNAKAKEDATTIFLTNNAQCLTVNPVSLKREELTLLALRLSLPDNSDIEIIIERQKDLQSQGVSDIYPENNKVAYVIYSFKAGTEEIEYQKAVNNIHKAQQGSLNHIIERTLRKQ